MQDRRREGRGRCSSAGPGSISRCEHAAGMTWQLLELHVMQKRERCSSRMHKAKQAWAPALFLAAAALLVVGGGGRGCQCGHARAQPPRNALGVRATCRQAKAVAEPWNLTDWPAVCGDLRCVCPASCRRHPPAASARHLRRQGRHAPTSSQPQQALADRQQQRSQQRGDD